MKGGEIEKELKDGKKTMNKTGVGNPSLACRFFTTLLILTFQYSYISSNMNSKVRKFVP